MKSQPLQIFSAVFFYRKRSGVFFGMMERFRILFRVLCSSCLSVVYVFLRGFAYVLRCCLRFCFSSFALGLHVVLVFALCTRHGLGLVSCGVG